MIEFLNTAAAGLGRCADCGEGTKESVQAACCPHGNGCNQYGEPDECDEQCKAAVTAAGTTQLQLSLFHWQYPKSGAAVTGEPDSCPEYFLQNAHTQGTYVSCGGNTLADLRENLRQKQASRRHGGNDPSPTDGNDPSPTDGTRPLPLAAVIAMVAGCVILLLAVLYQLCASTPTGFPSGSDRIGLTRDIVTSDDADGDRSCARVAGVLESTGTYKKERKDFARDSLAFARDGPSIYDQLGRGSTSVLSNAE